MIEGGARRERYRTIDAIKACAIIDTVFIHAASDPITLDALSLSAYLTGFASPAFLFASGFLHYRKKPVGRDLVYRWADRLLVPYVVASLLAFGYRVLVLDHHLTPARAVIELATGGAWGIYYFVPALLFGLLITPFLSRVPALVEVIFALSIVQTLMSSLGLDPIEHAFGVYGLLRSPFLWSSYFIAGWVTAKHHGTIAALSPATRRVIGVVAVAVLALICRVCTVPGVCSAVYGPTVGLANYAVLTGIFMLSADLPRFSLVELLSATTYPIYLYHFFFTHTVRVYGSRFGLATKPLAFVLGWVGSIAILLLARALLGQRARRLVG